ncbi:MAG: GldG family protein [Clostridia bacterium]|nr:GldG family protein [Clostridia bacterium]
MNIKDLKLKKSPKKLKNKALLKRGGYAMAITAAVMAVIVVLNVLLTVLAERLPLEFDMTADQKNSISAENIEYIKGIDKEVTISVCAKEDEYLTYMSSYAPDIYGIDGEYSPYYNQTIALINRYDNYNQKIKVKYLDTQDTSFSDITSKYSKEKLDFGDIIVSCGEGKNERYKIVNFQDVYELKANEQYAAYGVEYYSITGNNIETALTSAIAYATSSKDIKVAFITGHSKENYTDSYINLLKTNNYEVDVISDSILTSLSNEYDAAFIVAPTSDFIASELEVLSKFLDNDGKYDKGLVFFADAAAPYLKNLYSFLAQWGIEIGEGIVFETNAQNHMPDAPTVLGSYPMTDDEILDKIRMCITGYNVPIKAAFDKKGKITTTSLIATPDSVVAAPVGTSNSWTGADKYTKQSLSTVMQAKRYDYDDDNNLIENYVFAFSSVEFIYGDYSEMIDISNKDIAFQVAERAVGAEKTGISFVSKTIDNQSFGASITESSRNVMSIIFIGVIPILVIAAGIFVYIRRKNS